MTDTDTDTDTATDSTAVRMRRVHIREVGPPHACSQRRSSGCRASR